MIVSLNEIDSTSLLAARGAGYTWGLAEEAGKAARWLARAGLPWLPSFLAMLAVPFERTEVAIGQHSIRAKNMPDLSPLLVGAYLADAKQSLPITLHNVRHPIWLLPFGAVLGHEIRSAIAISWLDAKTAPAERGVYWLGDSTSLWAEFAPEVRIERLSRIDFELPKYAPRSGGLHVEISEWRELEKLAVRTHVPATDMSRLRGAGAGILDLD